MQSVLLARIADKKIAPIRRKHMPDRRDDQRLLLKFDLATVHPNNPSSMRDRESR
jgi:hypothetical protein